MRWVQLIDAQLAGADMSHADMFHVVCRRGQPRRRVCSRPICLVPCSTAYMRINAEFTQAYAKGIRMEGADFTRRIAAPRKYCDAWLANGNGISWRRSVPQSRCRRGRRRG